MHRCPEDPKCHSQLGFGALLCGFCTFLSLFNHFTIIPASSANWKGHSGQKHALGPGDATSSVSAYSVLQAASVLKYCVMFKVSPQQTQFPCMFWTTSPAEDTVHGVSVLRHKYDSMLISLRRCCWSLCDLFGHVQGTSEGVLWWPALGNERSNLSLLCLLC